MGVGVGDGWCLDLNSLDLGLDNWGSSVDIGMVSICQIVGISLRVSLGLTLLSLSLNSLGFSLSFNRLCNNIRMISISVRVSICVGVSIWENMVDGISDSSRCLNV